MSDTMPYALHTMPRSEALEIRFVADRTGSKYQLLASVTQAGTVSYTLHTDPHGAYSMSFPSSLAGNTTLSLPMKAYEGWQSDLMEWLLSLSTTSGKPIYLVVGML